MDSDQLARLLLDFLKSPSATQLACSYHDDALSYAGEVFLRLKKQQMGRSIRNSQAWVRTNAFYHLKSSLTAQKRHLLKQSPKEERL